MMRRKEREVKDIVMIKEIMDRCESCRIAMNDNDSIYIVPLDFGYTEDERGITLWFHGAKEGRKADLIRRNGYAAFEMDTDHEITSGDSACKYSALYSSVIGDGKITEIKDTAEKIKGLRAIMKHVTGNTDWDFEENKLNVVGVYALSVDNLSCKVHKR